MYVRGITNTAKNLWDWSYIPESENTIAPVYTFSSNENLIHYLIFSSSCLQVKSISEKGSIYCY